MKTYKEFTIELLEEYLGDQIDFLMFDLLTTENNLNFMVNLCYKHKVNRWDVIDLIKESIIEELSGDDYSEDDSVQDLIERDIELIPIHELTEKINLKNKKIVLFKIFEKYECLFDDIYFIAKFDALNNHLRPMIINMDKANSDTYKKIKG